MITGIPANSADLFGPMATVHFPSFLSSFTAVAVLDVDTSLASVRYLSIKSLHCWKASNFDFTILICDKFDIPSPIKQWSILNNISAFIRVFLARIKWSATSKIVPPREFSIGTTHSSASPFYMASVTAFIEGYGTRM